jgi:hypothetical protein
MKTLLADMGCRRSILVGHIYNPHNTCFTTFIPAFRICRMAEATADWPSYLGDGW